MSESSHRHADPSWPHPESAAVRAMEQWQPGAPFLGPTLAGSTRWGAPVTDYAPAADGSSTWGVPDPPAAVPDPLPGVEGPHTRPGWLTRGRGAGPNGAA